jgi:hypothetical protein
MTEPKPDSWAHSHMRWLALSRWDSEGDASPSRHTEGSAGARPRTEVRCTLGLVLLLLAHESSATSTQAGPP